MTPAVNPTAQKPSAAVLAQMFEEEAAPAPEELAAEAATEEAPSAEEAAPAEEASAGADASEPTETVEDEQ